MICKPTPLAAEVFGNIQAQDRTAVFLAVQDQGAAVSVGLNRTKELAYQVFLQNDGVDVTLQEDSQFALLMDGRGLNGSPRLVMYREDNPDPILQYCQGVEGCSDLTGYVFIEAHEPGGSQIVTVHAVFGKDGGSLLIDSSPVLQRHLRQCVQLIGRGA